MTECGLPPPVLHELTLDQIVEHLDYFQKRRG